MIKTKIRGSKMSMMAKRNFFLIFPSLKSISYFWFFPKRIFPIQKTQDTILRFFFPSYRIKFVRMGVSLSGISMPFSFPSLMHLSSQAIFLPRLLMVCSPSPSSSTCSALEPCTIFQYWPETMGMELMEKYLFNWSIAALAPPLREEVMAQAGFPASFLPVE